jgi:hypothetical protein
MAITKIQAGALPADVITTAAIDDASITHAKLHTTMDLSSKTVTLPTLSTLNTTGSVGIGTSSIATGTKLIIKAATDQNFEVEYTSGGKLRLSALNDARSANVPLQFTSTSFEFLSGNVGIGEINPVTPLHVSKDGNGIVTIERSNKTSGSGYFGINVEANSQATLAYDDGGSFVIGRSSDPSTQAGFSNDFIIDSLGRTGLGIVPNFTPGASRRKLQIGNGTNGALIAMGTGTSESSNPRIFSNQYTLGLAAGITTGELQFYTNDVERITVEAGGTIQMGGGDAPANPPIIMGGNNFSVYMGATNTNTINVGYNENQAYNLHINYKGYQSGTTQFRNLVVNDGKTADIARFKGEYKLLELPGAPSFRARVTQGFSGNNTVIVFQSVQHNIGNHYNSTNGRFTAPVTGSYFFGYQGISASSTTSNEQNMSLVINSTTGICDARARGYTEGSLHLKTVVYLTAGDYVTVVISNANTSTYPAGFHNQFFGHFIG